MTGLPRREPPHEWIQTTLDLEPLSKSQVEVVDSPLLEVIEIVPEGEHHWAVVCCTCDTTDANDPLVVRIAQAVRDAYGEVEILEEVDAQALSDPEASVGDEFDLEAVIRAFRRGLPDPVAEAGKVQHLTNYRSEAAELLAKTALAAAYSMRFQVAPQRGKTNANQPVLGFDSWGFIVRSEGEYVLVLVQVKGTEDPDRPPREAATLVDECARVTDQEADICRALSVLLLGLRGKDPDITHAVVRMLEVLGRREKLKVVVAPVVVRGRTRSHIDDLSPLRSATPRLAPAVAYGLTVSLEQDLLEFGRAVMAKARGDD